MIIIHAGFMLAGLVVLAAGVVIAMGMRRKRWWLTVHRRLGSAGALCVLLGFVAAISTVSRQTGQHFSVPHAWLGIIVVLFVACTYLIGTMQIKTQRAGMRPPHRWAGRATLVLLFFNVLSGLSLIGIL